MTLHGGFILTAADSKVISKHARYGATILLTDIVDVFDDF